jgi:hypothetical protein
LTYDEYIHRLRDVDLELLKRLGSDYDEEGIPYWEKWGSESKFDAEFDVDKNTANTVE